MSNSPAKILFVTSECAPLVKTGGLADVSASLPAALTAAALDTRILLPGYRTVLQALEATGAICSSGPEGRFPGWRLLDAGKLHGVPLLVLDCPALFDRDGGPYQDTTGRDWDDNAMRFAQLCRVAARIGAGLPALNWQPDIVHCNDWQTGLIPAYLRHGPAAPVRTVFTIHNLAYQGLFAGGMLADLGLPPESFAMQGLEFFGQISFLKAGLHYSDVITTVSETYAREIQGEAMGMGFHGLLSERAAVLSGIQNGIDTEEWNPATDARIVQRYDASRLEQKQANKIALQRHFGLAPAQDGLLFATVCRLAHQKGVDLILEVAEDLIGLPAQLIVCGSGDHETEAALQSLARRHPQHIGVFIGFDEDLAHRIEAGADAFLMPSRFEPCGMNQMYSQRYGTIPVVHATGGLVDSVVDAGPPPHDGASGFVFSPCTREQFREALCRAASAWRDPPLWRSLQIAGMHRDFSWTRSAARYAGLYRQLRGT